MRKKIYIGAHLHSVPWTTAIEFASNLGYLYEVVRTNFSTDVWTFRNFWRQFRENDGATYRRKWKLCSASERKKRWKPCWNRPINGNAMPVWTMTPLTNSAPANSAPASERYKQKKQTPHFRTYSRRALYDLPQSLHVDRARWDHQKRCNHFLI